MNVACVLGRLTDNPKITNYSGNDGQQGTIARYTLAVDRPGRRDQNGQNVDFINCVVFGKGAEFAQKYLAKGRKIAVSGRIQTGSYTNKDGHKVYTTDILVAEQNFADGKPAEQQNQNQGYQYQQNAAPQTQGYQYQNQQMPNQQYAPVQQTVTQPQMNQNYGYQMPQNPVPTAPPQMTNEQFMQIPPNVDDGSLPFN